MIRLTKLNEVPFVLNCDLIETIQENPDTTIHLVNGTLYIVKESMDEVVALTKQYKQEAFGNFLRGDIIHGKER